MSSSSKTVATLQDAADYFEKNCQGSPPKDVFEYQAWDMAGAHYVFMKAGIQVYEHAPNVPKEKVKDFILYALQWTSSIEHHHDMEETVYYPSLNPKFDSSEIITEHAAFTSGLHDFQEHLVSCLPAGTSWGYGKTAGPHEQQKFDAQHVLTLMDQFVPPMASHLTHEIELISAQHLRDTGISEQELKKIGDVQLKHLQAMPLTTFATFFVLHAPPNSDFPPAPAPIRNFLVPYVLTYPNRKLWQFAPKKK